MKDVSPTNTTEPKNIPTSVKSTSPTIKSSQAAITTKSTTAPALTDSTTLHKPTWRVISVLEAVAGTRNGATLSEIAKALDCPRSTLTPILKTLTDANYLTCEEDSLRYHIGRRAYIIGNTFQPSGDILDLIKDQMELVAEQCNENVHLGILEQNEIMYLIKVTGSKPLQLISSVGRRLPAYATALGKALLYDHSLNELEALFPEGLTPLTEHTLPDVKALYQDIHKDPNHEFTYEQEEITKYARCIAMPLRVNGRIVAALSISFIIFDADKEHVTSIKNLLRRFGTIIEKLMSSNGFPGI